MGGCGRDASAAAGTSYELVELADFDVPLLTDPTVPGAAARQYADERTRAWGAAIDSYDGFVWVTPEPTSVCADGASSAVISLASGCSRASDTVS